MTPTYADDSVTLYLGDCLDVLATLPDASVDAVVTDPPYGLEFMGKHWDRFNGNGWKHRPKGGTDPFARDTPIYVAGHIYQAWCEAWVRECLRVLKPGGHLLAFGGTRTYHRLACAVEDAGFEVRDCIAWLYGSGFPKSLDVSKAIDKVAGHWRGRAGEVESPNGAMAGANYERTDKGEPVTAAAAAAAAGWGTALKPAHEPIVVARKPLTGTVAANWIEHGTGALNIDGCRVGDEARTNEPMGVPEKCYGGYGASASASAVVGRWPSNVVLDPDAATRLDRQTGVTRSRVGASRSGPNGSGWGMTATGAEYDDEGGASRFFPVFRYEAKAPTTERPTADGVLHPTVKPLDLMRWLVRLVTPPGGVVLEPFAGSGTTAEACIVEGFRCVAIEREPSYLPLILARITKPIEPVLFGESSLVDSLNITTAEQVPDA